MSEHLNYGDKKTQVSEEMVTIAMENNLQVVQIICDEANAKPGDVDGVSFMAMTPRIPTLGEFIKLNDGKYCLVERVVHALSGQGDKLAMIPTIWATIESESAEKTEDFS